MPRQYRPYFNTLMDRLNCGDAEDDADEDDEDDDDLEMHIVVADPGPIICLSDDDDPIAIDNLFSSADSELEALLNCDDALIERRCSIATTKQNPTVVAIVELTAGM